jgi:hypothetical protein
VRTVERERGRTFFCARESRTGGAALRGDARRLSLWLEEIMRLDAELLETAHIVPNTLVDRGSNVRPPSPEEGLRLMQAFLRVKRSDLRAQIINFVAEILKVQDEG